MAISNRLGNRVSKRLGAATLETRFFGQHRREHAGQPRISKWFDAKIAEDRRQCDRIRVDRTKHHRAR